MLKFLFRNTTKIALLLTSTAFASIVAGRMLENDLLAFIIIMLILMFGVFSAIYIALGGHDEKRQKE